jgi:exopolyphosphatase / guanosine-5'-triphosphate,3'-diphosphate pyrophosphatase
LRLAVILNGQRNDELPLNFKLNINDDIWTVATDKENWLEENKLLNADLITEQQYWSSANWQLNF